VIGSNVRCFGCGRLYRSCVVPSFCSSACQKVWEKRQEELQQAPREVAEKTDYRLKRDTVGSVRAG
jgi:hypothetical protein